MIKAFDRLDKINQIKEEVKFRNDSRLIELFKMTVADDRDRLNNAKDRMIVAERNHEMWLSKVESARGRLKVAEDELQRVLKTCEQLENGVISSSNNLQDIDEIKTNILKEKSLLKVYQDVTSVYFDFNCPQEVVAGCVAVKGDTPIESKMKTFVLDKYSAHLQDDIWQKISDLAFEKPETTIMY